MSGPFDPYRVWLGIPPGQRPPTHYQLLGIAPDENDRDVIHAALLRLSAYVRNFQTGKHADDATRILNELAEAKACLFNAASRARYDAELAKATTPTSYQAAPSLAPAIAASAPVIELGELALAPPDEVAPRRYSRPPPPLRPLRPPARKSPRVVWLLPLTIIIPLLLIATGLALRPSASKTPTTLQGQVMVDGRVEGAPTMPPMQPSAPASIRVGPTNGQAPAPAVAQTPGPPSGGAFRTKATPPPGLAPSSRPPTLTGSNSPGVAPADAVRPPAPLAADKPLAPPAADKPPAPPAEFAPPVERRPVPAGPALTAARSQVDSAFSKNFRASKTALERVLDVHKLYYESQVAEKPILRFAYLEECRDRAVNLGEAGQACQAIEEIGRLFEVDPLPLKLEALKICLEKAKKSQQAYTVAMLARLVRARAASSSPAVAEQFGSLATAAERKSDRLDLAVADTRRPAAGPRLRLGMGPLPGVILSRPGLAVSLYAGTDFQQELLRRVDRDIDFHFGFGSPVEPLPADAFSIRWAGWLTPPVSGKYIITAISDDGVRVQVDDQMLIDYWYPVFGRGEHSKELDLAAVPHRIVVEYNDRRGPAGINLRWAVKELSTEHTIPSEAFSHDPLIGE